jgi:high-affinity iron transporter
MVSAFVITFREALEAALIIGIILAYLYRTKQTKYNNVVYYGIGSSVVASIIVAVLFNLVAGGFEGSAEKVFEGIVMLFAALLITFMILWMLRQKNITRELEGRVQSHLSKEQRFGLFLVTFLSVLREGVETVIFLNAASMQTGNHMLLWAVFGLVAACALGYVIFVMAKRVNLKIFFNVSSILLILFAAGLTAHGVHELEEGGIIPETGAIWDLNPLKNSDGSYPALHEKGAVGGLAKDLLGYNGNPSLPEVISYIAYILIVVMLWRNVDRIWKKIDAVEEIVQK